MASMLVPAELRAFLDAAKLPHLAAVLVKHGFDDVEDYPEWTERSFTALRSLSSITDEPPQKRARV